KSVARAYTLARSLEDVDALAAALRGPAQIGIAPITDDTSGVRAGVTGWSFSTEPGTGMYVPLAHTGLTDVPNLSHAAVFARLGPVLEDDTVGKAGHDLKFTTIALARAGVELTGPLFDTSVASYLVDATRSSHSIEGLAIERANYRAVSVEDVT